MEWLTAIRESINYMESHIAENITSQDVADHVFLSSLNFQRGFAVMTGYSVSEYIRNRRLYLAAVEISECYAKVIDTAYKYGYDTPESFTKAFFRFHGVTPKQVKNGEKFKTFLPIKISVSVHGGDKMNYKISNMFGFKLIGFVKNFSFDNCYEEIPKFWDEICEKYAYNVYSGNPPRNAYEKALMDNCIGEYGVCIDDYQDGTFKYLIAGRYTGGEVPEGMMVYEFPQGEWAVFDCVGPNPATLQSTNTKIFTEWLPDNPDFELSGNANVEWYDPINGEKTDSDFHSAIWIPIKRK